MPTLLQSRRFTTELTLMKSLKTPPNKRPPVPAAVEKVECRRCHEASPTKRRLNFGASPSSSPISISSSQRDEDFIFFVDDQMNRIAKEQTDRWNFDFVEGVPLPGRYLWEPVLRDSRAVMTSKNKDAEMMDFSVAAPFVDAKSVKQTLITDIFRCRKRRSSSAVVSPKSGSFLNSTNVLAESNRYWKKPRHDLITC